MSDPTLRPAREPADRSGDVPSTEPDAAVRPGGAWTRLLKSLSWSGWQGVAALVGVVALAVAGAGLVVAVAAPWWQAEKEKEQDPPTQNHSVSGNCNAQGSDNHVECNTVLPPPVSRAGFQLELNPLENKSFLIAGGPGELPTPPPYTEAEVTDHCSAWDRWVQADSRVYRDGFELIAQLSAGEQEIAAIKGVRAQIFKKSKARVITTVRCAYGGDRETGYAIEVDAVKQRTVVTSRADTSGRRHDMPPAPVALDSSGFTYATISVRGEQGYLYEGKLIVEVAVNNENKVYTYGSFEKPFRWINRAEKPSDKCYDWDIRANRWVGSGEQTGCVPLD